MEQVFVAGATGRLGARIVRELLLLPNVRVRAGVRDPAKAARYLKVAYEQGLLPSDALRRINLVPFDITNPASMIPAIGSAAKVGPALLSSSNIYLSWSNVCVLSYLSFLVLCDKISV